MISYSLPFPPISWFIKAFQSENKLVYILSDLPYAKMTYRNRYYVTGAQGLAMLNIPIKNGRNQRIAMQDIMIDNTVRWQDVHWKTLMSHYKRAPFYDYLAPVISHLFTTKYDNLHAFNIDSIATVQKILINKLEVKAVSKLDNIDWQQHEDITKFLHPKLEIPNAVTPTYWQVFQDRMPFQPNLSILDYLFNEGIHL